MSGEALPATSEADVAEPFGPWNPGLVSTLPRELYPLATIFRPENVFTSVPQALELHDLTGIELRELVRYRPERLALHEVLIRVTCELRVPSGERIEDLGINFRRMVSAILARHLAPRMPELVAAYDRVRAQLAVRIAGELEARLFGGDQSLPPRRKGWFGIGGGPRHEAAPVADEDRSVRRAEAAIGAWKSAALAGDDPLHASACRALARVVAALVGRHARVWGTRELIASIATDLACNDHGSDAIGAALEPWFVDAVRREGYAVLPRQAEPLVMNTKGPSAAGKSTLRPLQRALAGRIGVAWADFALISPDIWRKQLLDYATLGAAYKYGGTCTGDELHAIDQKLDRAIARRAARGQTTHLLIDRFRFDSFAPGSDVAGSNLLTRFGQRVYLFFVITPPQELVVRAWRRGLEVGRYKAVDDILAHGIQAYAGMPELFFTWALAGDKRVHCEFVDNSVPFAERPRTIAFGWDGALNVLDVKGLLDVVRFQRVNVDATGPERLYDNSADLAPERNTRFLEECVRRLPEVRFADRDTGRIWLWLRAGRVAALDPAGLDAALADPDTRAGVLAVAPDQGRGAPAVPAGQNDLEAVLGTQDFHTLGGWGAAH
jgi:hypothetical protein